MKKELTLEEFSIKNGEEYQEFVGLLNRRKTGNAFTPSVRPTALPMGLQKFLKPPTKAEAKLEFTCKNSLIKKTKKCRDYFEQKLRKEQEAARLAAEAAAKEAQQQKALLEAATKAVATATTEAAVRMAQQNADLARQLADLRTNQANIAKQRADEISVLQSEIKQNTGGEISNNQADLVNKILSESTLDKMQQAVSESPLLQKAVVRGTESTSVQGTQEQGEVVLDEKQVEGAAPVQPTSTSGLEPKKNNMLLYGALGVGVLLLVFGKKIFGAKSGEIKQ
jgi:flagellar biosynthesis GTPase FlhF